MLATCYCITQGCWKSERLHIPIETNPATETTLHTMQHIVRPASQLLYPPPSTLIPLSAAAFCANEFVYFVKCQLLCWLTGAETSGAIRGRRRGIRG